MSRTVKWWRVAWIFQELLIDRSCNYPFVIVDRLHEGEPPLIFIVFDYIVFAGSRLGSYRPT